MEENSDATNFVTTQQLLHFERSEQLAKHLCWLEFILIIINVYTYEYAKSAVHGFHRQKKVGPHGHWMYLY